MTRREALVLAGHGSRHGPGAAAPLHAHADRLRARGGFSTVRTAFWAEEPTLHDVRHTLPAEDVYVVPVLTSEGYFADEVFPRELGLSDAGPGGDGPTLHYAEPVGTHDAMTAVIEARVRETVGERATEVGVAVVGHGTDRHEGSARATERHAGRLRARGSVAEAVALFLDEAPNVADLTDHLDAAEVVVVPFFVADGPHTTGDVPAAMSHPGVGQSAAIDGTLVHYTGAVGTDPALADVIVERARESGASPDQSGGPTAPDDVNRAFLDWVAAGEDGRIWGELAIEPTASGYDLRHRADRGRPRSELTELEGPAALRSRSRTDDADRYRPLSGARTLRAGWLLTDATPADLVAGVQAVYPGSVDCWARERAGALEVTHFRPAAERQSGVYAGLAGLDRATIAAAAEAVCGGCVRRRCWDAAPDEPLEVPRGEGDIPCREPCPFVRSAAGAFADAEGDAARQPDPTAPPGDVDDPGNGYRVRFRRAIERRDGPGAPTPMGGSD